MRRNVPIYSRNGLQSQIALLTAKLEKLPIAKPPIRQKLATVAATSTSSTRPFSLGLCSTEGAAIMHKLDIHPVLIPNRRRMNMKRKSELMNAPDWVGLVVGR